MGKNREVKIKLSTEEKEKLERKAKEVGLPLGTYMRLISLKSEVNIK